MKTTKSNIYKLEVERGCGCKVAGDYEDPAYKKPRGTSAFTACDTHKEAVGIDLIEEMLREFLDKEALEAKAPEPPKPVEVIHPRTAALMVQQTPEEEAALAAQPARTLRASGSNGTAGHRPASAPPKQTGPSAHRPAPKTAGASPFRRADPSGGLSARAAGKLAVASTSSQLQMDIGDEVPEDHRVTNVLEEINFLGDPGDDEGLFD